MKIVFDLDNTIVDYTNIFVRLKKQLNMPHSILPIKNSIKRFIIKHYGETEWTKYQGIIYGSEMKHASLYPGFVKSISNICSKMNSIYIVSHRSKLSHSSKKIDLHSPAKVWVEKNLSVLDKIGFRNLYLEETIDQKINRINKIKPNYIVDDLLKILVHENLDPNISKVHFNPEAKKINNDNSSSIITMNHWSNFPQIIGR